MRRLPPCTAGWRVFTLPPSISGAFVMSETSLNKSEIIIQIIPYVGGDSLDRNATIPDLFGRSSRSQQSYPSLTQTLGELEDIGFVAHRQQGFGPDGKRMFAILFLS